MKQELDVLTAPVNAQQASEIEEKKYCNDEIRNKTASTFIQSCWQRLLARKELQRLQNEAKGLSIQLVSDSRTNHLEERGNDTIQARSNSDFDVKSAPIQFYGNSHNSQSDRWIGPKLYMESHDMFSYLGLNHVFLPWTKLSG
jgi:carboxypeptidase C (cathepsin A)